MTLKNIVWLASYPKSGNTWTRAFLVNYLLDAEKPVPINEMHRLTLGDSLTKSYEMVARGPVTGMGPEQILRIRPHVLRAIANNGADINFVKCHNANTKAFGHTLIPPEYTRFAIYIVRNPLDVVPSYSRHFGLSLDKTVFTIGHPANTTLSDDKNVKQFIGTWSDHVESWAGAKRFPLHVMRYEDMKADPVKSFGALVKKLGLTFDQARLEKAIAHASFKELKRQEEEYGFIERSANNYSFFHGGQTDGWKSELTPEQIAKVRQDHGKVMRKYGYF